MKTLSYTAAVLTLVAVALVWHSQATAQVDPGFHEIHQPSGACLAGRRKHCGPRHCCAVCPLA